MAKCLVCGEMLWRNLWCCGEMLGLWQSIVAKCLVCGEMLWRNVWGCVDMFWVVVNCLELGRNIVLCFGGLCPNVVSKCFGSCPNVVSKCFGLCPNVLGMCWGLSSCCVQVFWVVFRSSKLVLGHRRDTCFRPIPVNPKK